MSLDRRLKGLERTVSARTATAARLGAVQAKADALGGWEAVEALLCDELRDPPTLFQPTPGYGEGFALYRRLLRDHVHGPDCGPTLPETDRSVL